MPDLSDTVAKCRMGTAKKFYTSITSLSNTSKRRGLQPERYGNRQNCDRQYVRYSDAVKRCAYDSTGLFSDHGRRCRRRRAGRDDAAEKQRRIPHDETGRQGHSKRSRKGCRRDFFGHVSRKGFPETGSLFLVFGMIDQNAFTAAFSAASALRYQLR